MSQKSNSIIKHTNKLVYNIRWHQYVSDDRSMCFKLYVEINSLVWDKISIKKKKKKCHLSLSLPSPYHRTTECLFLRWWGSAWVYLWRCTLLTAPPSAGPGGLCWWCCPSGHSLCRYAKSLAPWVAAFRHLRWWRRWRASFTELSAWQDRCKSDAEIFEAFHCLQQVRGWQFLPYYFM